MLRKLFYFAKEDYFEVVAVCEMAGWPNLFYYLRQPTVAEEVRATVAFPEGSRVQSMGFAGQGLQL
jgi:hypothetical protein